MPVNDVGNAHRGYNGKNACFPWVASLSGHIGWEIDQSTGCGWNKAAPACSEHVLDVVSQPFDIVRLSHENAGEHEVIPRQE